MSLKAVLDSIDGVATELLEHYVEKDGKHFLAVDSVDGLELSDPRGLKSALAKEKSNAAKSKKSLDAFGDLDPIAAREALGKMDEIANWTPDEKAKEMQAAFESQLTSKLDKERTQQLSKFETEQKKLSDRNTVLVNQLNNSLINMAASKAIIDADGEPDLLLHKVVGSMKIVEEDGKFTAVVIEADGTPRMSTKPGNYEDHMTIEEFIEELKEKPSLKPAFKGTGQTGTGAKPSSKVTGSTKHTITTEEAKDFSLFKRKRAAALKDGVQLTPIP